MLRDDAPELIAKLKELALGGDLAAIRLWLERVLPSLKPKDSPAAVPALESGGTLLEQSQAVMAAVAAGELAPSDGATMMQGLAAQARVKETEELERRIEALQEMVRRQGNG